LNFQKIHYHIQKFFVPKYFFVLQIENFTQKNCYFFSRAISIHMHDKNLTTNMPAVYVISELTWNERPKTENYIAKTVKIVMFLFLFLL